MEEKSVYLNKGICRCIVQALSKGGYTKEVLLFHHTFINFPLLYCLTRLYLATRQFLQRIIFLYDRIAEKYIDCIPFLL